MGTEEERKRREKGGSTNGRGSEKELAESGEEGVKEVEERRGEGGKGRRGVIGGRVVLF